MPESPGDFVQRHVKAIHSLESAIARAIWEVATSGDESAQQTLAALQIEFHSLFQDESDLATLREWSSFESQIGDPILTRQIQRLYLTYLANRQDPDTVEELVSLQVDVQAQFMSFRGQVEGETLSENDLRQILNQSTDSMEVRRAWEATKQIGREVADKVRKLAILRNASARKLGYQDYFSFSLAVQEIDEEYILDLLETLEQQTREPYRRMKLQIDADRAGRFRVAENELRPWHYGEPFFQELPASDDPEFDALFHDTEPDAIARQTFARIGLAVEDILARSDLYERSGKDQHAFCLHLDRMSDDVRILCNLRPNEYWMATILHELGHAVYDMNLKTDLPYLLREPAHTSSTEAIAMLFGRLTRNPKWLTADLRADAATVERIAPNIVQAQRSSMLLFVRWALVVIMFERALYENPERDDLNRLWWDLVERYQMLRRPNHRDQPDWAAKIHIPLYPVYYQNYVLGELMASQLQSAIARDLGALADNPIAGVWLNERLFRLGATLPWNETLEAATGERLSPNYFVRQFIDQ